MAPSDPLTRPRPARGTQEWAALHSGQRPPGKRHAGPQSLGAGHRAGRARQAGTGAAEGTRGPLSPGQGRPEAAGATHLQVAARVRAALAVQAVGPLTLRPRRLPLLQGRAPAPAAGLLGLRPGRQPDWRGLTDRLQGRSSHTPGRADSASHGDWRAGDGHRDLPPGAAAALRPADLAQLEPGVGPVCTGGRGVSTPGQGLPRPATAAAASHLVEGMTRDSVLVMRPLGGSLSVNKSRAEVSGSGLSGGGAGCSPGVGVLCGREDAAGGARKVPGLGAFSLLQAGGSCLGLGHIHTWVPSQPTSLPSWWAPGPGTTGRPAPHLPTCPEPRTPPERPRAAGAITGHALSPEPALAARAEGCGLCSGHGRPCLLTWATGSETLSLSCLPPGAHVFSGTSACEQDGSRWAGLRGAREMGVGSGRETGHRSQHGAPGFGFRG